MNIKYFSDRTQVGVSIVGFALLVGLPLQVIAAEPTWNQFRGPGGMGVASSDDVTTVVDKDSNLRWRTPLKGVGWSSPVTDGEQIWVTSAIVTEATEEQRRARLANVQFADMKDVAGQIELLVQCIDANSGQVVLEKSLGMIADPSPIHPMNSYASPTPLLAEGRVVCHFGGYGTFCLDTHSGETIWSQKLVVDHSVGPGSSPIRIGDKVLVACDGIDQQFVVALNMDDGSIAWKTARPPMKNLNGEFQKAYSTPLAIQVNGRTQAVVPGAQWICAYEPETGQEIWRADHGPGFSTTPMPIFAGGLIVFSTGYMQPQLVAVDPTGSGDVTETHIRWTNYRGAPARPSLASDDQYVYLISDDGIASAVSLGDGATVWRQRIGGTYSASPLISGNKIFIASHDGEITVFQTGDRYQEVNQVDLSEQIMASPVPMQRDLLLRTKDAIYRFKG